MLTLFQTPSTFGLPNASPFCMKLDAFLRWQNIEFQMKPGLPNQGPFRKVPFIEYDGKQMGDSSAIIDWLLTKHQIHYEAGLNLQIGHAYQRMVEEHLYWAMVYFRWTDESIWPTLREAFFGGIPLFVRPIIVSVSLRQAKRALYGQGMGRLTKQMVEARVEKDLSALNQQLSSTAYICGDSMTHFDLSIWAVLSQLMQCELKLPISKNALQKQSLVDYLERINRVMKPKWQDVDLFSRSAEATLVMTTS
jgi:glutathione S-transferase